MFRFGRSAELPPGIRWSQLLPLLEDDDRRAAVAVDFPEAGRQSFLQALRRVEPLAAERVLSAGRQLEAAQPLSQFPTIAVAGMLNSGKTSLVSTFLSKQGRERALRGDSNREGTHRFVLWLPSRWREDSEVWSLLLRRMGEALGQPPELLSNDPPQAHQQYNNAAAGEDALAVPLVATDEGLDEFGVGLLDCPDLVSDAAFGRGTPEMRRQMLRRAAMLCSAFIVVTGAEAIRDATLGDLLRMAAELMPGVPRFLAVNKVRPRQTPDAVWANSRQLVQMHRVDDVYAAYDYDIPAAQPFIPKFSEATTALGGESMPLFYRLAENPDDNPPQVIDRQRCLLNLPSQLNHAQLFEQVRLALEQNLRGAIWSDGIQRLTDAARHDQETAIELRQALLAAVLDFFARRVPGGKIGELRLHQSERIVRQLSQAFADGAPWYARFGMRLHSRVRRLWGGANDLFRKLAPTQMAEQAAQAIKDKMKLGRQGSMLTPERLAEAILERVDRQDLLRGQSDDHLTTLVSRAIDRFDHEDFTALDPERLQLAVAEVWRQMPVGRRMQAGLTPLAIIFATFGAALTVPIDFGATQVLFAATFKELMLAAGLSFAGAAWGGGLTAVHVEQQAAQQQLSNFFAVLLDSLGLPRWDQRRSPLQIEVNGSKVRLPEPTVAKRNVTSEGLLQWHLRDEFLQELQQYVQRP